MEQEIKMLKNNFLKITTILFCTLLSLQAYGKNFTVKIAGEADKELKVFMSPMRQGAEYKSKPLKPVADNTFSANVPASSNGLYRLVLVKDGAQHFTVVYYPEEQKEEQLTVDISTGSLDVKDSRENLVLSCYTKISSSTGRALWHTRATEDSTLYRLLTGYITSADSLLEAEDCAPVVEEYIKLWAYTSAYNGVHSAVRAAKRAKHNLLFSGRDVLGDYGKAFDCTMATYFQETNLIIAEELPIDTVLVVKFDCLYSKYCNKDVLKSVSAFLISKFMARHDFCNDFDGGLEQLRVVVDKYGLDKNYITDYKKRRATIKGAAFPADVVLRDAEGKVVDFSTFKGKYVYIDIWASWCVPCIKEIPQLQKLEKEVKNPNVVFVSISIDKKESDWTKKMKELGLHGHQLLDKENALYEALNPKGVPFFVIYDKDGRLFMYDAPRPSVGARVKELLEGLK